MKGARSILLTEDNLNPIKHDKISPDLIQDLPKDGDISNLIQAVANKRSQHEKLVNNNEDDDDYVEADSVARDVSEDMKDDDISVSGPQVQSNAHELVHKETDSSHAEWTKSKDKRYVFYHFCLHKMKHALTGLL